MTEFLQQKCDIMGMKIMCNAIERRRIELEKRGINLRTFELIEVEINDI